jgi:GTPase SAR1 family protein
LLISTKSIIFFNIVANKLKESDIFSITQYSMSDNISFSSNRSTIQKYKIVLVGDQNVGKSSIIARYIRNEFDPSKNVISKLFSPQ